MTEINFPRNPKLVLIQQTSENNIHLVGYHGNKKRIASDMDIEGATPEGTQEVIEEFRQSIDAPLKGKKQ